MQTKTGVVEQAPAAALATGEESGVLVDRLRLLAAFRVLAACMPDERRVRLTLARGALRASTLDEGGAHVKVDLGSFRPAAPGGQPQFDVEVSRDLADYFAALDGELVWLATGQDNDRPCLRVEGADGASFWLTAKAPTWKAPTMEVTDHEMDGGVLATLLGAVRRFCSTDEARPNLHGVFLRPLPGGGIEAVGTDGHRMGMCQTACLANQLPCRHDGYGDFPGFLMPAGLVTGLSAVLDAGACAALLVGEGRRVRWLMGGGRTGARVGAVTLSVTDPLLRYPDYVQAVPERWTARAVVDRETLLHAARRLDAAMGAAGYLGGVSVMLESAGDALRLSSTMVVTVGGQRRRDGEAREGLAARFEGDPFAGRLSARYLVESLEALAPAADVVIEHLGGIHPVLLYAEGGPRHVIMPMRGD